VTAEVAAQALDVAVGSETTEIASLVQPRTNIYGTGGFPVPGQFTIGRFATQLLQRL
jgi:hypothetical protein